MEGIGSEVSQKIRAAIKAKLIELGAYVDDELPDYIMVMVANKRTRSQMDEDLQLFLTSNTKTFTSWLHTVLQKLQEVTVASFESKKDSDMKKSSKRKKSEDDSENKCKKAFEENIGRTKKHSKKHKEGKKAKKSKHKSKEKLKFRSDKKEKDEVKEKLVKETNEMHASQDTEKSLDKKEHEKTSKSESMEFNEAVGKAILGNLKKIKKHRSNKNDFSSLSSSCSEDSSKLKTKNYKENGDAVQNKQIKVPNDSALDANKEEESKVVTVDSSKNKKELIEDEFNIEPLKPIEKCNEINDNDEYLKQRTTNKQSSWTEVQPEKTISVPTEELLKEHNKLLSEQLEGEEKSEKKKLRSDSDESVSPEEMRKQLLLSRAKKKLENSKLAERMKSNSPDVLILEETSRTISKDFGRSFSKQEDFQFSRSSPSHSGILKKNSAAVSPPGRRFSPSSHSSDYRKSRSAGKSPSRQKSTDIKSKQAATRTTNSEERKTVCHSRARNSSPLSRSREIQKKQYSEDGEKRKNVIKISESLEMEKNLGIKKEVKKSNEKESHSKKRSVSSRVVTITGPEAPEIPSIVKVKPREYIAKDKQANKALILKAVADAEKSIATIHTRNEPEPEPKKDALFTKNLRGKRYEKLAVTLSNIRKSPEPREKTSRRVSLDSEKSEDRSRMKLNSSEVSEGIRGKSDLLSRKMSKNEDQFISSKTTIMEKNDKYIRCWLEGVEKAVKDDEIVNPSDMEDLIIHSNFTDEENESNEDALSKKENEKKRKRPDQDEAPIDKVCKNQKLSEKEIANLRPIPKSKNDDGPQIVVTLDGLDSKTIKDIILRNKEAINGPILSSRKDKETKEKSTKRASGIPKEKSPSDFRKLTFEKISDRFGRLNKTHENTDSDREKGEVKNFKLQNFEKNKEKSSTESKNRQLIAQLSEKFGKVDREFENKKRRYPEQDRRYLYDSRKGEREDNERNGKYKRSERRSNKEGLSSSPPSKLSSSTSAQICKYYPNCKNLDCLYYHPKKCRFDDDCTNPDCKYVHSETSAKKKSKWYSKS